MGTRSAFYKDHYDIGVANRFEKGESGVKKNHSGSHHICSGEIQKGVGRKLKFIRLNL